jgi:hypothetical protein
MATRGQEYPAAPGLAQLDRLWKALALLGWAPPEAPLHAPHGPAFGFRLARDGVQPLDR